MTMNAVVAGDTVLSRNSWVPNSGLLYTKPLTAFRQNCYWQISPSDSSSTSKTLNTTGYDCGSSHADFWKFRLSNLLRAKMCSGGLDCRSKVTLKASSEGVSAPFQPIWKKDPKHSLVMKSFLKCVQMVVHTSWSHCKPFLSSQSGLLKSEAKILPSPSAVKLIFELWLAGAKKRDLWKIQLLVICSPCTKKFSHTLPLINVSALLQKSAAIVSADLSIVK